jgi:hypothetical protein
VAAVALAASAQARSPLIAAAGDIACDPGSPHYNGGRGSRFTCQMKATSDLILSRRYRAVIALGDLQYLDGRLWKFRRSYGPTWGRFKPKTIPVLGNHEYGTHNARGYFRYFNGRGRRPAPAARLVQPGARALAHRRAQLQLRQGRMRAGLAADRLAAPKPAQPPQPLRPRRLPPPALLLGQARAGREGEHDLAHALCAGVDVVLNGHDHDYERFAPQGARARLDRRHGVVEFVVGTGGHSLFNFGRFARNSRATGTDLRRAPHAPRPWPLPLGLRGGARRPRHRYGQPPLHAARAAGDPPRHHPREIPRG